MSKLYADAELTPEEEAYLRGEQVEVPTTTPSIADPAPAFDPEAPLEVEEKKDPTPSDPASHEEPGEHDDPEDDVITSRERDPKTGRFAKTVPLAALHQARAKTKEKDVELQTMRERWARGEERMNTLLSLAQPADPAAKRDPANPMEEPDVDPAEDIVKALDQQRRRTAWVTEQINNDRTQRETHSTEQQIVNAYKADATAFFQKEPAFADAWKHLTALRHAQMKAIGIDDERQRNMQIAQEERALVHAAFQSKKSPSEMIWQMALASGFQKSAAPANGNGAKPNGQHQHNVQALQAQQRGMAASVSLSGAGKASGTLTWAKIADMPQDEFNALLDSGQLRRLMAE